jgi:hypothetical protein
MKTIFDEITRDELINRINALNENSIAQWGKMNIFQMLKHCTTWEEMVTGKQKFKRVFLGRLFGKMALRSMIGSEKPLNHNIPTLPELTINETNGDIESEKKKWVALIQENALSPNPDFIHPFIGKMTTKQIGQLAYKHIDHHLRQFNC